jgi:hypothetical protein
MKIALVQFYAYHEEVLAPQIDFLTLYAAANCRPGAFVRR